MEPITPFCIELPQKIPGWEKFVLSWVIRGNPTIVVDVGPKASIDSLISQLVHRGINQVDYVWLTHLHIDHAGGLASFLERFPTARAVAHAKGLAHLIDPSKLWEGSLSTLKEKAVAYGPIEAAAPERLIPHDALSMEGLTILETPGHAPFHLSFCYQDLLFAGESAGIYLPLGNKIYLRPPTPPRFFFEQAVDSVDRMLLLKDQPIYFGHAGSHPSSRKMLKLYREQLYFWKELIAGIFKSNPEEVSERSMEALLKEDPMLKYFQQLEAPAQEKEKFFMANSIAGFVGYLKTQHSY